MDEIAHIHIRGRHAAAACLLLLLLHVIAEGTRCYFPFVLPSKTVLPSQPFSHSHKLWLRHVAQTIHTPCHCLRPQPACPRRHHAASCNAATPLPWRQMEWVELFVWEVCLVRQESSAHCLLTTPTPFETAFSLPAAE